MNDDENSGFSSIDLNFNSNDVNNGNNVNTGNNMNNVPGINGGFTSSDLNNNENINTLSYDFSNNMANTISNSNNGTNGNVNLNNSIDFNTNNGMGNSLINVIAEEQPTNNNVFNKNKEERDFFNVPPDLEGGFNATPPDDLNGDFIVPPNFSNNVQQAPAPVQNIVSNQPVQTPPPAASSNINLINSYQDDDDDDDGILSMLFPKRKKQVNSGASGLNIKNRILRDKNIFTNFEVFRSFFKLVVDVAVFIIVAILLYKLYVKESSNVVKKLSRDANQYYKVCTIERAYNQAINMSGAFGIYQYDNNTYLEEVVLWSASKGMIKVPDDKTESDVVSDFANLADTMVEIGVGEIVSVNNQYKKTGIVYTSKVQSFNSSQYPSADDLVKRFIEYGANCR